jgi:hypothetical protein
MSLILELDKEAIVEEVEDRGVVTYYALACGWQGL